MIAGFFEPAWPDYAHPLRHDLLIINDAYNANPESMSAAMRALVLFAQERGGAAWAFVGKMNELGQTQAPQSAAIGALAVELGIDHLVEINAPEYGEPVSAMVIHQRPTIESALDLVEYFAPGDVVLVKASRSQGFEVLAESLERAWKEKSGVDS
jgi:UDP-N-acetylmuramoyl-tripeptide--D-alanyl-D-alanine ligase